MKQEIKIVRCGHCGCALTDGPDDCLCDHYLNAEIQRQHDAEADTLANMVDSDWACQELPEDYRF